MALATSGGVQVGYGYVAEDYTHALKWTGSASSVVDLHPSECRHSKASGISGDQVVGECYWPRDLPSVRHALLWTSGGVVDLHPSGFYESFAHATDGTWQVGEGGRNDGGFRSYRALLWRGTADSVVDLHPAGYSSSRAKGVSGGQQVGDGLADNARHALLWTGSAQSVVDLHPSGYCDSVAEAAAAGRQVGWGSKCDGQHHALLWNSTAESVVDLHLFLPAGLHYSEAHGIDASGNIIGSAFDTLGTSHAVLWVR
jgi:uncharacterized membrane protein